MRISPYLVLVFVGCGLVACTGSSGPTGPQGPSGPPGQSGSAAPTTGVLAGTITDALKGDAIAGVSVIAQDAGGSALATATSGADGSFALTLTSGSVDLAVTKQDYTSPGLLHTGVVVGRTVHVVISLSESASGAPSVALAAPSDDVGYGAAVSVTATASDPEGDKLAYDWSNDTSPPLGEVSGSGPIGSVQMPTMQQAFARRDNPTNPGLFLSGYAIEDRFGVLPILTDTRGAITATVRVSDGRGQSTTASATIYAASVASAVRDVAVGQRVYLNSGHDDANTWSLVAPSGATAAFDDPTSRTPSVRADLAGAYTITEGGNTLTIFAGTWRGVIAGGNGDSVTVDSDCMLCHGASFSKAPPDMFTPWAKTGHATMFTRGINGDLGPYDASCLGCHTVGYDQGVASGGFDDVAAASGWSMPKTLASTNWDAMLADAPAVAKLANVQCESCHGPQTSDAHMKTWDENQLSQPFLSPRISYKAEACGPCHAGGDDHEYSEWSQVSDDGMGHASRIAATTIGASSSGLSASCGRCHTAQGYALYSHALSTGKVAISSVSAATLAQVTSATAEPVTCVACHDPHDATNPNQLRWWGNTPNLPSGFAGYGMGAGAGCLTCHNSRNGAQTGSETATYLHEDGEPYNGGNPTGYSAPHDASQGDVFAGRNAYFMGSSLPMVSKHAAIQDTCVGCHMTLQPRTFFDDEGVLTNSTHLFGIAESDVSTLCSTCHGANVDGAGIQGQVQAQLGALGAKIGNLVQAKVNAVAGGVVRLRVWDSETDFYSSASLSNVAVDVTQNPVVDVELEEIHGQIGFVLTFAQPITVPFVDGTGAAQPSKAMTALGVQLGSLKDNQATPVALYALSGSMVRAAWNYFLIANDNTSGLHNPSFVSAVLARTAAQPLAN